MAKKKLPYKLRIRCNKDERVPSSPRINSGTIKPSWRTSIKNKDPQKYEEILNKGRNYNRTCRHEMSLADSILKNRNISSKEREKAEKLRQHEKYITPVLPGEWGRWAKRREEDRSDQKRVKKRQRRTELQKNNREKNAKLKENVNREQLGQKRSMKEKKQKDGKNIVRTRKRQRSMNRQRSITR